MLRNQETLVTAAENLKEHGIKNTPQRQVILAYLMTSHEHPSIEMIYDHVRKNGFSVSLATVYNTLELLQDNKLITEVAPDNDGHMRYDHLDKPHYHVICVSCNKIVDVYDDSFKRLEQKGATETGYQIYSSQYEVYGLCPACQAKQQALQD
ncbi:Fur family transcriptional regulator [Ligilactobacillus pobuzihii]|uniref:Fur family transcriptional regulator n=1 Tax=Ligilactobacillus pobuzihii TaxID=449659 RepID=UPI0003798C0F|nr:Fur family transcriptional regulator [Ligilactobacillus pobuzihii]GEN48674.1 transcriptional repressor [Ligilactobacillus pobuzihii]